jgi:hypothetical protein
MVRRDNRDRNGEPPIPGRFLAMSWGEHPIVLSTRCAYATSSPTFGPVLDLTFDQPEMVFGLAAGGLHAPERGALFRT